MEEASTIGGSRRWQAVNIGFREGAMRIILRDSTAERPSHVLQLEEVHAYFDRGIIGSGLLLIELSEPGSFAWYMSETERSQYRQIMFIKNETGFDNLFRALAKRVFLRPIESDDINYPG